MIRKQEKWVENDLMENVNIAAKELVEGGICILLYIKVKTPRFVVSESKCRSLIAFEFLVLKYCLLQQLQFSVSSTVCFMIFFLYGAVFF